VGDAEPRALHRRPGVEALEQAMRHEDAAMREAGLRAGATLAWWIQLLAVLALSAGLGCSRPDPRPHVVLVVIDQLRQDFSNHFLQGVNELARRGVVFQQMRSAAPWTYPSVVSLLSGLYPQQHGAEGHERDPTFARFDPAVPLVQKQLAAAGYATAAFVTNPYLLDWNAFHLGFARFDGHFVSAKQRPGGGIDNVWDPTSMFADSVNAAVMRHFAGGTPTGPEFTYVHYIDVHGPWDGAPFPPTYKDAIRFVDAHVVELYRFFRERYEGNLLFFVTSDHGRAFGDDETIGDGPPWRLDKHSVHDFNLRVPFLILPSDRVPRARRIAGAASLVDFVPTLLDWLGEEQAAYRPGRSLLAAIRDGTPLAPGRATYARQWSFGAFNDALVMNGHKYVRYFRDPAGPPVMRRIFDLAADPRETRSLGDRFGLVALKLHEAAGRGAIAFEPTFAPVPEDVEAPLRALGYLK
jgi:arylsulfatase A-like enzyme